MISTSFLRRIYEISFWAVVIGIAYWQRGIYDFLVVLMYPTIGPFAHVVMLVAVLVLLFMLHYLKEAIVNTIVAMRASISEEAPVNFEDGQYTGSLVRSARKLEKRKDFAGAAEIYESLEAWHDAAMAFEKAQVLSRAAAAWEKAGEAERALDLYEADMNYEKAASYATSEGMRERAAKNYKMAGEKAFADNRFLKAAEFFERAHDFDRAGRIYENLKRDTDALRCYERANSTDRIERLLLAFVSQEAGSGTRPSTEIVRKAAEVLVRNGKLTQAAEALMAAGDFVRAGEVYEQAEIWEKAGEAFYQAEAFDRAERCYNKVAEPAKAADFRARVAMQAGDWQEAGKQYVAAGKQNQAVDAFKRCKDFLAAGRVYDQMGRFMMAGEMYSAGRDFQAAGEAYAKAHDWRNAGECFETSGDLPQAIQAFVEAGNFFRAGMLDMKLGDYPRAIEHLQRVAPTSPDWKIATGHLATAFFNQRRYEMARELFEKVVDQIVPSNETLSIFYTYGRLLEADQVSSAVAIYRRIMGVNVNYEDVPERISALEQGQFTELPMPTPEPGAPSSPSHFTPAAATISTRTPTQTQARSRRNITQMPETRFGEEGRYAIVHELGRGGMAIVYKAFDQHLEREVALKTFPLSRHVDQAREEAFLREARLIARLSHPNIVTIFDCGHMDLLYYIAMEYVPGENLKQLVKRRGPLSLDEVRHVFTQLADALEYAHSQHILHSDIKPGNAILRSTGDIKMVDFGLSKIITEAATSPVASDDSQATLVGTPQYMAPEQILGGAMDERTDIYSLGLTLFYVLTGRTPFEVKRVTDPIEISKMQVNASFPVPSMMRATLPPKLDLIFVRCTQKNPADRYPDVQAFMQDFSKI